MNHHSHTCLNCGEQVTTAYCGHCGQKAETHRFTIRHFIEHDIVHGMFHLDIGFLHTAKQLFTRPGYAIREYIEGKRISYFNPVTFLLLLIAFNLFVQISTGFSYSNIVGGNDTTRTALEEIQHLLQKYSKQLYLVTIPLISLSTFLVFRKTRQNFAEHLVLNTYKEAGGLMINTIFILLMALVHNVNAQRIFISLMELCTTFYGIMFYWQYFKRDYPNRLVLALSILAQILLWAAMMGILAYFVLLPMLQPK